VGGEVERGCIIEATHGGSGIPFIDEGETFFSVVGISEFKIFGFWEEQYGEGAGGFFLPLNFI
jgi:hypothetical protein